MASDEIVWQIINQQFCSFKLKVAREKTFCRKSVYPLSLPPNQSSPNPPTQPTNPITDTFPPFPSSEHNVTGLCNRQSCPLANSRYATVRSDPTTGRLYLCTKTIERAHQPSKLWERIRLSPRYETALSQIEEKLIYWPEHMKHRCKQRLTRLTMVAIRTQRLMKEEERLGEKVVPKLAPKVRRREATRERKAEAAAKVERAIERELMERLRSGAYGDRPLNVEEGVWKRVLKGLERGKEGVRDEDLDEGVLEEEEEAEYEMEGEEGVGEVEYVSGDDEEEDEEQELGDLEEWLGGESPGEDEGSEVDSDEADEDDEEDSSGQGSEDDAEGGGKSKPAAGMKRKGPMTKPPPRRSKGPKLEIEYENEEVEPLREAVLAR